MRTLRSPAAALATCLVTACAAVPAEQAPEPGAIAVQLVFDLFEELLTERRTQPRPLPVVSVAAWRAVDAPKAAHIRSALAAKEPQAHRALVASSAYARVERPRGTGGKR